MPVTPATLVPNILANMSAVNLVGISDLQFANALAISFVQFLKTIPVTTVHTGVLGSGVGTGRVSIEPSSGISILSSQFQVNAINGPNSVQLATAIINALTSELNANASVQVAIVGTSNGTGIGNLSAASGSSFIPILTTQLSANQINGPIQPKLSQAIGIGVSTWLKSGVINTIDTGAPVFPYGVSGGAGQGIVF